MKPFKFIDYFDGKTVEIVRDEDDIYVTLKKYDSCFIFDTIRFHQLIRVYPISRWTVSNGYACINLRVEGRTYTKKYLHRLVTLEQFEMVDHKNGDRFDNRMSNLRPTDHSKNRANAKPNLGAKYKGIKKSGKRSWAAVIRHNKTTMHIGTYSTEREAAHAYNEYAKQLFNDHARVNKL